LIFILSNHFFIVSLARAAIVARYSSLHDSFGNRWRIIICFGSRILANHSPSVISSGLAGCGPLPKGFFPIASSYLDIYRDETLLTRKALNASSLNILAQK